MHKCKDMCRYNSADQSVGRKIQIYILADAKYVQDMCRICTADTKMFADIKEVVVELISTSWHLC